MKNLKCYVGLNNRFVMCETFPDDEEHRGLHEMLEEFVDADVYIANEPLEQGFYNIEFGFDDMGDGDAIEEYLIVENIKKMSDIGKRTQEIFDNYKKDFLDIADKALGELYTDVAVFFESDMYSNYREEIRLEMSHEYKYSKFKDEWAKDLRRAIFVENREELSELISDDILKRVKNLEDIKQEYEMFRYSPKGVEYKDLLSQNKKLREALEVCSEYIKSRELLEDQKEVDWDLFQIAEHTSRITLKETRNESYAKKLDSRSYNEK